MNEQETKKPSMTESEFYMTGYMACYELEDVLDFCHLSLKPTEEDYQAVHRTRDLFARLLADKIRSKVTASEWLDNDTTENIRRYFSKADETELIEMTFRTKEEEESMLAEADKQPRKDMPFWLRMVKALRRKEKD